VDIRQFFFRNRSFTPIPIALMIIYFAGDNNLFRFIGFILLLIGETIRIWAVSHAGGATRTRNVGAPSLCSSGPYAHSRNPLYVGNMLMYIGIVLIAGVPNGFFMVMVTTVFFLIQYTLIISLEEETLRGKFGDSYIRYVKSVPRLIPRFSHWSGKQQSGPSPWKKTLLTEQRSLQTLSISIILILFWQLFSG